jgi:hypothetical protein
MKERANSSGLLLNFKNLSGIPWSLNLYTIRAIFAIIDNKKSNTAIFVSEVLDTADLLVSYKSLGFSRHRFVFPEDIISLSFTIEQETIQVKMPQNEHIKSFLSAMASRIGLDVNIIALRNLKQRKLMA